MIPNYIQFGKEHGKSFRIVQTPSGMSTNNGNTIPDKPGRISIVTPENGDSFNWPAADKKQIKVMRKNWGSIQKNPATQYKMDQIRRAMK